MRKEQLPGDSNAVLKMCIFSNMIGRLSDKGSLFLLYRQRIYKIKFKKIGVSYNQLIKLSILQTEGQMF